MMNLWRYMLIGWLFSLWIIAGGHGESRGNRQRYKSMDMAYDSNSRSNRKSRRSRAKSKGGASESTPLTQIVGDDQFTEGRSRSKAIDCGQSGRLKMTQAIGDLSVKRVQRIIRRFDGCNINDFKDKHKETFLQLVLFNPKTDRKSRKNKRKIIGELIKAGIDLTDPFYSIIEAERLPLLHYMAALGDATMIGFVKSKLSAEKYETLVNYRFLQKTPLRLAVQCGSHLTEYKGIKSDYGATIKLLIDGGGTISRQKDVDSKCRTAFFEALILPTKNPTKQLNMLEYALGFGLDLSQPLSKVGMPPVHFMAAMGDFAQLAKVERTLRSRPVEFSGLATQEYHGMTPLLWAMQCLPSHWKKDYKNKNSNYGRSMALLIQEDLADISTTISPIINRGKLKSKSEECRRSFFYLTIVSDFGLNQKKETIGQLIRSNMDLKKPLPIADNPPLHFLSSLGIAPLVQLFKDELSKKTFRQLVELKHHDIAPLQMAAQCKLPPLGMQWKPIQEQHKKSVDYKAIISILFDHTKDKQMIAKVLKSITTNQDCPIGKMSFMLQRMKSSVSKPKEKRKSNSDATPKPKPKQKRAKSAPLLKRFSRRKLADGGLGLGIDGDDSGSAWFSGIGFMASVVTALVMVVSVSIFLFVKS